MLAALTNYLNFSDFTPHKCISLKMCGLTFWTLTHWAKIKMWTGLHFLLKALGEPFLGSIGCPLFTALFLYLQIIWWVKSFSYRISLTSSASQFHSQGPWWLHWAHPDNPAYSLHLKVLNLITSSKSFCHAVTYSRFQWWQCGFLWGSEMILPNTESKYFCGTCCLLFII